MLFNSFSFIFIFLPICLVFYYALGSFSQKGAQGWLCFASIIFYSWLGYHFLPLLISSIIFNYSIGILISKSAEGSKKARLFLACGVAANLLTLIYYKYLLDITGFLINNGASHNMLLGSTILPLGISFFTFTQIGFLIDSAAGLTRAQNFIEYVLFVTIFPHVIAGPILHHREIMPQFRNPETYHFNLQNFSVGLAIFVIGLGKKVVLADNIFASRVNNAFAPNLHLDCTSAWLGALSYFFQLYFDFSGYSEMALGLAKMFNMTFPVNFDSPYKALNIIDFWQRWHVSLTRFLTLYIYSPVSLTLNRHLAAQGIVLNPAAYRHYGVFTLVVAFPTILTMTLAGIWHGSGTQFLIFGILHGFYLTITHAWRIWINPLLPQPKNKGIRYLNVVWKVGLTCLAVIVGQIFFRAVSVSDAMHMLTAMVGWGGDDHPTRITFHRIRDILVGFSIVWILPNLLQIFAKWTPALSKSRSKSALITYAWQPTVLWGVILALLFTIILLMMGGTSEFLYFRF